MSAISGSISPNSTAQLQSMLAALTHRGPDGCQISRDDTCALGYRHRALSQSIPINQPFKEADGRYTLLFDGVIYNHTALVNSSQDDSSVEELLLNLYRRHGPDFVKQLRGAFAIAIWDSREQSLLLARDQMGQKPLFYLNHQGGFAFASEVKALLATRIIDPSPDYDAMWHYMSLRFLPDQYTFFKGIDKLPAATWLLRRRDGTTTTQNYWQLDFTKKTGASEDQAIDQLEDLLSDTVKAGVADSDSFGAFLSGGIDSSLITALLAKNGHDPFPTFSIGVKEQKFNELPYARMVSQQYNLLGHETIVEADLVRLMPSMILHLDEPSDPFGVGVYLVAREAAKEVKVVLSGDGGDENFAGYDRFAGQRLVDYYAWLPAALRRHFIGKIINLVPDSFGYKSIASKLKWLNAMSFHDAGRRYAESMSFLRFTQEHKERLFTPTARAALTDSDTIQKILTHFDSDHASELVDRMLRTDLMTRMPDHLLAISDRMTMAHSLEARAPLIDHRVTEFAAALPANYKLKGRSLKHILRRLSERHLPHELIHRPKQGFGFPIATWLRTDLKNFTRSLLLEQSRFVANGTFEAAYVKQLVNEHLDGKADHNFRLWILINLEFWHRLFLEDETVDSCHELIQRLL